MEQRIKRCNLCGTEDESRFYSHNYTRCKSCQTKRLLQRRAEKKIMIALKNLAEGIILDVHPETVVITDIGKDSILLTAIDGEQHIAITHYKATIIRAIERLYSDHNVSQYTIDSETYTTHKKRGKQAYSDTEIEYAKVITRITITRDTRIIEAQII